MLPDKHYREILFQLRKGKRPVWRPGEEELADIEEVWQKSLRSPPDSKKNLLPLFCLLSYTQTLSNRFDSLFCHTLSLPLKDAELLVAALGCLHRQVLDRCEMRGERIPPWLTECLKNLVINGDPEVFHWCLRTIERMGSMSIVLRESVLEKCPGPWESLFNSHKRVSRKMVFLLKKRWDSWKIS